MKNEAKYTSGPSSAYTEAKLGSAIDLMKTGPNTVCHLSI